MKITLTGATGFVGSEIVRALAKAAGPTEICLLTRNPEKARAQFKDIPHLTAYAWNPETEVAPATALTGTDVVVHLAGENVGAGRWNEETKRRILESRRLGTRNLVSGINALEKPPALISTSATGIYGSRGDLVLNDDSAGEGTGFLAEVCRHWEAEALKAKTPNLTIFRVGVVLGAGGGMLEKLLPIFKLGIGGHIGDGKHWMGWIDRRDLVALYVAAIKTPEKFRGIYNAVAPEPVTNEVFTKTLGAVLHRPTLIPVPAVALKFALGEMAEETALASQRVVPTRLLAQGYSFLYPNLNAALTSLVEEAGHS